MTGKKVSILIPTYNERKNIKLILNKIKTQDLGSLPFSLEDIEVVIMDSGSTDGTLEEINRFRENNNAFEVRLYKIPKRLFHHAITRNTLAKLSKGEYLVFLNGDAIPYDDCWLCELIKPLVFGKAHATFSRQVPHKEWFSLDSLLILAGFPSEYFILTRDNFDNFFNKTGMLFSTASGAIIRRIFFKLGGFNRLMYIIEDQEFAWRLLKNGYRIAYVPKSIVIHSHKVNISNLARRYLPILKGWGKLRQIHPEFHVSVSFGLFRRIYDAYEYTVSRIYPLSKLNSNGGVKSLLSLLIKGILLGALIIYSKFAYL